MTAKTEKKRLLEAESEVAHDKIYEAGAAGDIKV